VGALILHSPAAGALILELVAVRCHRGALILELAVGALILHSPAAGALVMELAAGAAKQSSRGLQK